MKIYLNGGNPPAEIATQCVFRVIADKENQNFSFGAHDAFENEVIQLHSSHGGLSRQRTILLDSQRKGSLKEHFFSSNT